MNRMFSSNSKRAQRGVTLVELAVVVAVVGILAGVGAPTIMTTMRRQANQRVAAEISGHMRTARNQAMSRGEAVVVRFRPDPTGATAGSTDLLATSLELPDGSIEAGATPCVSGAVPDTCPSGSSCLGNVCWGNPARSCRQLHSIPLFGQGTMGQVQYRIIKEYVIPDARDVGMLGAECSNGCEAVDPSGSVLCFSPDGRVEKGGGGIPIADTARDYCEGEGFVVTVGDRKLGFDAVRQNAACGADPAEYEKHSAYFIRAAYNGEIGFRSSK